MPHKAKSGKYKDEITLLGDKYPVTKHGKLNCNRVRSAIAFGVMHGDITKLKKSGLPYWVHQCDISSKYFK
jgi:hypothetical protein